MSDSGQKDYEVVEVTVTYSPSDYFPPVTISVLKFNNGQYQLHDKYLKVSNGFVGGTASPNERLELASAMYAIESLNHKTNLHMVKVQDAEAQQAISQRAKDSQSAERDRGDEGHIAKAKLLKEWIMSEFPETRRDDYDWTARLPNGYRQKAADNFSVSRSTIDGWVEALKKKIRTVINA